jgi:hypothetical protein
MIGLVFGKICEPDARFKTTRHWIALNSHLTKQLYHIKDSYDI